ncbi:MAG TPA: anthranilate synthase component I family protein [Candidatus Obscuribacterales bacterium]
MSTTMDTPSAARRLIKGLRPPCVLSLISDTQTPVSVFHKLIAQSRLGFLFESAEGDTRLARFSFVGVDPLLTVELRSGQAVVQDGRGNEIERTPFDDPTAVLAQILGDCRDCVQGDIVALPDVPFAGGLVGYMGYAATRYFERIPQQSDDLLTVPEGIYGLYDSLIIFDHQYRQLHIVSRRGQPYAQELLNRLDSDLSLPTVPMSEIRADGDVFSDVQANMPRERFLKLVDQCKEYICEGQVFQIVVSQRFSVPVKAAPLDVYRVLQTINPSPYAYFLQFPGFSYLGSSPETFVRCMDGNVSLRAIAGTRPRGRTAEEDKALEAELKSNEKELAEHHMLVDLGRNDLGRISRVGTVKVGEIAALTKYAHVMHLATEICGQLREDKTCFDAFRSCFPRGTVSGAPKVRAMQLLSQLEPERRGIYSGVVGYFDFKGNTDGAIAIRSALLKDGIAHINAGAGIVLDSDPEAEYEETRNKAKSIIKAVVAASRRVQ